MSITFETEVGTDQVLHLPAGVVLPSGRLHVTIQQLQPSRTQLENHSVEIPQPGLTKTQQYLLALASEHVSDASNLPKDLAAQHDHYLYGTPKR